MKKIEIVVPFFVGYYNSILDGFIEQEVEMEMDASGKTYDEIEECLDYRKAFHEITIQWLNRFNYDTGFDIEFKEVDSPREYNFTTDKLIGFISVDEVKKAIDKCAKNKDIFQNKVLDRYFKSCDGFISFYSNDIDDWFDISAEDVDHNEAMAYVAGAILCDMDDDDLLDSIHSHCSVYEAAQHVFK